MENTANWKAKKLEWRCEMNEDSVNKALELIKETMKEHNYVSINIHHHKEFFDLEINIL